MPLPAPDTRLVETAERGETLEVILALHGHIRRARDGRRWCLYPQRGRPITFPADWVVAVAPGRVPTAAQMTKPSTTRRPR
jgi:hypothetical protein